MSFFERTDSSKEVNNSLWVERYRPKKLDQYVGNEALKARIQTYLADGDIPHLLLYGRAGTGKTTLAKLIINSIDCDYIIINASDENNVDTVRNKIKGFAATQGFKPYKIVILDEADYLTPNSQAILRNLMETYSQHCRFILTCNYVQKIIEPIQSRCQDEAITPPSKKEVAKQLVHILDMEGISYDVKDLVPIIDASYPDIRKAINTIQRQSKSGKLKVDQQAMLDSDFKHKIIEILKSDKGAKQSFQEIRQVVADNSVKDFSDMYSLLYEKVDEFAPNMVTTCILIIADSQSQDALVVDKEISFMACIIKLLAEIR